jgi:hypothetical protein
MPLIIAALAAGATYLVVGSTSPLDIYKHFHRHAEHNAISATTARRDTRPVVREETLDAFDSVVLETGVTATITIDDEQSVAVSGSDDPGHRVTTYVHDGSLIVSGGDRSAELKGSLPHLKSLKIDGPGKVDLVDLEEPLSILANGPAYLHATGEVDSLALVMNGPAHLDLAGLDAKDVTIRMNSGGEADIAASRTLVAELHGVGHVRYLGDPRVTTKVDGQSSIARLSAPHEG